MEKVYVVYYDNGHSYEDHDVSVNKIFLSEDSASKYVTDKNKPKEFVAMTKAEYYSQDPDCIDQTYEDWLSSQESLWDYYNCGAYYYSEVEVLE